MCPDSSKGVTGVICNISGEVCNESFKELGTFLWVKTSVFLW